VGTDTHFEGVVVREQSPARCDKNGPREVKEYFAPKVDLLRRDDAVYASENVRCELLRHIE
jgi:hypothetical protein